MKIIEVFLRDSGSLLNRIFMQLKDDPSAKIAVDLNGLIDGRAKFNGVLKQRISQHKQAPQADRSPEGQNHLNRLGGAHFLFHNILSLHAQLKQEHGSSPIKISSKTKIVTPESCCQVFL